MGAYREIGAGVEGGQRGQRSCPDQPARFTATVALLRPPTIPSLDATLTPAWGFSPLPIGPNRETLVSGLITLNGLGVITDADLLQVLDAKPHNLALWGQVQDGFSRYKPVIGADLLTGTKRLFAQHFPIISMVQRALEWFDLGAISDDLMEQVAEFPLLMQENDQGFDVCHSFADTVKQLSTEISTYLNQRFTEKPHGAENSIERRSQFYAAEANSLQESIQISMHDFLVFQNGFPKSAVSESYWNTFLMGVTHAQCHLMPMMTVDDLMDVVVMFEEERFFEVEVVNNALAAKGIVGQATDDQINAVIQAEPDSFSFIVDADDYRCAVDQELEMNAVRAGWSVTNLGGLKGVHNFGRRLRKLPEPTNAIEVKLKAWLIDLNKLLPKKKGQLSPLREVIESSECEGQPYENMYMLDYVENYMVNENLQRFFEGFMETGDENAFRLDWTVSAGVVIKTFENLNRVSRLFDSLESLSDQETPAGESP